jgi:carboxymethylenebutenolidase
MRTTLPSGTPIEVAHPADGRPPSRGLVLIPDIGGLRPVFDEHVRRIADEQGWAVVAVEPWPGRETMPLDEKLQSVSSIDDATFIADLVAAADHLAVEPVGVMGFCMGGMFTLKAAGTGRFHRAAAFYGMVRVPDHWRSATNIEPLDAVTASGACPALAIVGTVDQWTPADDVHALEAAGVVVHRYEGADHGFAHDPSRPAHRPADAADAWAKAMAFLGEG